MSDVEHVNEVLREWVSKADHDLRVGANALSLDDPPPTEIVCFHAQQCIEKYLKSLLVMLLVDFPKTHNISHLLGLLPRDMRPDISEPYRLRLANYAVLFRYPGASDPTRAEARAAVALARRVRAEVRRKLPKAALRRPKPHAK